MNKLELFDNDHVMTREPLCANSSVHYHVSSDRKSILKPVDLNEGSFLTIPSDNPLVFIQSFLYSKETSRLWNFSERERWVAVIKEENKKNLLEYLNHVSNEIYNTGRFGKYIKNNLHMFEDRFPIRHFYGSEIICWKMIDVMKGNKKIGEEIEFSYWLYTCRSRRDVIAFWLIDLGLNEDNRSVYIPKFISNWDCYENFDTLKDEELSSKIGIPMVDIIEMRHKNILLDNTIKRKNEEFRKRVEERREIARNVEEQRYYN